LTESHNQPLAAYFRLAFGKYFSCFSELLNNSAASELRLFYTGEEWGQAFFVGYLGQSSKSLPKKGRHTFTSGSTLAVAQLSLNASSISLSPQEAEVELKAFNGRSSNE